MNGHGTVDDNISSGGTPSWDTLFSSTYGGNDTVSIFSPHYDVHLGDGDDILAGGIGGKAYGDAGNDRLDALLWEGQHFHYGGSDNDRLNIYHGGPGATYSGFGGSGRDRFFDGSYDSTVVAFVGGSDDDVVIHSGSATLVMALNGSGHQGDCAKSDVSIEGVVRGSGDDDMTGSGVGNLKVGGGGADVIRGLGGNDFLIGESRDANFVSAWLGLNPDFSASDALKPLNTAFGGAYASDSGLLNDSLYGGAGNDVLSGGAGADLLDGGSGKDWVTFLSSTDGAATVMSLQDGGTAGHAEGDVYISIENVQGSGASDTLGGNALNNQILGMQREDLLYGLAGNDTLDGGDGLDTLDGGRGADVLTGGNSEDAFLFAAGSLQSVDSITDFQTGFDEIRLSAATFRKLGPVGAALNPDNFATGSAAQDTKDFIIYDDTTGALSYDFKGSRAGGLVQFALLTAGLTLTADDFLIVA